MLFRGEKKEVKKVKKNKSKKTEERELDDIWKLRVKERDEYVCQVCKKKVEGRNCHAHHILPKGIKGCRWDINNGITLCYNHHKVGLFSAHMNAVWFAFWLKTNRLEQFKHAVNTLARINRR